MWKVTVKGLLAHKLRLALTALAIVLGVTFISGTLVLTDTLHTTFTTLFGHVYQNVDFEVRGKAAFSNDSSGAARSAIPSPSPSSTTVRKIPGVAVAEGTVTGYAQFVAPDGKAITTGGAPTIGLSFDPNAAAVGAPSRSAGTRPPRPTRWSWTPARPTSTTSGSVTVCGCSWPDRPQTFTISGIVKFGTADNLAGATLAAFDLPTAQTAVRRGRPVRRHRRAGQAGGRQGRAAAGHRQGPARPGSRW